MLLTSKTAYVTRCVSCAKGAFLAGLDEAISLMKWLKFQTQPDLAKKIIDTPVNKSKTKKKYHSYDKSLTPLSKLYYPESD